MRILYVTGDSFTFGVGLPGHNPYTREIEIDKYRYSAVLAKLLNVDRVINTGRPSGSNQRIVRKLYDDLPMLANIHGSENVFVAVGFTTPARFEVYDAKRRQYIPLRYGHAPLNGFERLWQIYSTTVYDRENLAAQFMRDVCSVECLLSTLNIHNSALFRTTMPNTPELEQCLQTAVCVTPAYVELLNFPVFSQWAVERGFHRLPCMHFDSPAHESWANFLYTTKFANVTCSSN